MELLYLTKLIIADILDETYVMYEVDLIKLSMGRSQN